MTPRLGFRPHMRVRGRQSFALAYAQGGRARGATLVVVARANGTGATRLGLSVGRRTWKSAVRRNRVRRVFREAFRLAYRELPVGFDLILLPASPRLVPELEPTRTELVRLAEQAARRHMERAAPRAPAEPEP